MPVNESNKPRVELSRAEPRPTRHFDFTWKPNNKTLRITLQEGSKREAQWVGLSSSRGPIIKTYQAKPSNEVVLETHVGSSSTNSDDTALAQQTQDEVQVELEPTSIQDPLEDPLSEDPCPDTTIASVLEETSRELSLRAFYIETSKEKVASLIIFIAC